MKKVRTKEKQADKVSRFLILKELAYQLFRAVIREGIDYLFKYYH